MSSAPNSCCQAQLQKNKDMNNAKQGSRLLNRNFLIVNNAIEASQQQVSNAPSTRKKPNLVPRNYRQFLFTMLSRQEKWNLVFEKLIDVLDRTAAVQNETTELTELKK
jgi:hypothetical protein